MWYTNVGTSFFHFAVSTDGHIDGHFAHIYTMRIKETNCTMLLVM